MTIVSVNWNIVRSVLRQRFWIRTIDQGNAVVNYTEYEVPYTRIIEHKHFEFGTQEKIRYFQRVSGDDGSREMNHITRSMMRRIQHFMQKYKELAEKEENVIFGGRLGLYRYMDMHHVVDAALQAVREEMK